MKSKKLRALIEGFIEADKKGEDFLKSINISVRSAFYDNGYVDSLYKKQDLALRLALGDLYDDVYWFLNDWQPGFEILINSKKYTINNIDDYFKYLTEMELVE